MGLALQPATGTGTGIEFGLGPYAKTCRVTNRCVINWLEQVSHAACN